MPASEKVSFPGADRDTLAARLERPNGPVRAFALFAHCFSCSKDILAASRVSRQLAEQGFAVLRFDFTGLGQSEGDFANTNFSSNVTDLVKAADWLREHHRAPALLIGHSLGGAAVIAAAEHIPEVKALATIGAPADAAHVRHQFLDAVPEIEAQGLAQVSLAGRPFTIKKQFLDDIEGHKLDDAIAKLRIATLIAHAPLDATVGVDNATRLFVAAKHPKSFLSLDAADHLLTRAEDARHAAAVIAAWAARYVDVDPVSAPPKPVSDPRSAVVQETGAGGYHGWAVMGEHAFTVDEPESVGGLNGGPSPYQLLSASLAACTTMTLRMYFRRKGWELGPIRTEVRHSRIDGAEEGEPADLFRRIVSIDDALSEEQASKVIEIANKCPVHRTLERGAKVETEQG